MEPLPIETIPIPPEPLTRDMINGIRMGKTNTANIHNTATATAATIPATMLLK